MTKIAPTAVHEQVLPTQTDIKSAQRLRLRRFAMSVATYAVAIVATFLITRIGIGVLNGVQWAALIGLCLVGIAVFLVLFLTGANLRFAEPSLTREQIIYASLYGVVAMYWLPDARPIILLFFLPPFSFGMLSLTQRQYLDIVACVLGLYAALLGFEYLQDPQGFEVQYQFFLFVLFGILISWFAFFGGYVSKIRRRLHRQKEVTHRANEEIKLEIEERKHAQLENEKLIIELKTALGEVKTLSGLLPICSSCKKIRDDNGDWNQIESYIGSRSEAEFSHGICPDCAKEIYPDMGY